MQKRRSPTLLSCTFSTAHLLSYLLILKLPRNLFSRAPLTHTTTSPHFETSFCLLPPTATPPGFRSLLLLSLPPFALFLALLDFLARHRQ